MAIASVQRLAAHYLKLARGGVDRTAFVDALNRTTRNLLTSFARS